MENHTQSSKDNPGWNGSGIPSLAQLILRKFYRIVRHLIKGDFRIATNLGIETLANLGNFYLRPRLDNRRLAECPCCGWQGPSFVASSNWRAVAYQSKCPQCDSRSRHRGLACLLSKIIEEIPAGPILVFAPEIILLRQLTELSPSPLQTTDYHSVDVDFPGEDIQKLSFGDNTYSLVVCNHVLEHVPNDQAALFECARILVRNGMAIFTIPGDFYQEETWNFDKPDSNGHHRHYGMDVVKMMKKAFGQVRLIDMSQAAPTRYKIHSRDYLFLCVK